MGPPEVQQMARPGGILSRYSRGAMFISFGWVGIIVAGVGAFTLAKSDLDKKRHTRMETEGPLYRVRQRKEGVRFEDMDQLKQTLKSIDELKRSAGGPASFSPMLPRDPAMAVYGSSSNADSKPTPAVAVPAGTAVTPAPIAAAAAPAAAAATAVPAKSWTSWATGN